MTTDAYDDSVRDAVARETVRRKRVLIGFLASLAIPIAVGAYVLAKAPTEIESIAKEVSPIVSQNVGGELTEKVTKDVVARTEPALRQTVSRQVSSEVDTRVSSVTEGLRGDIAKLQATTQRTSQLIANTNTRSTDFSRFEGRLASIDRTAFSSVQTANDNREAIVALTRQLAVMDAQLKKLQTRIEAVENRVRIVTPR
jgi:chromosome segregation ATPase